MTVYYILYIRFTTTRYDTKIWAIGGELTGNTEVFNPDTNSTDVYTIDNFRFGFSI